MGQATGLPDEETLDLVLTNALIIDWKGIYKVRSPASSAALTHYQADIGIKNHHIVGIGKAGNPDVMQGVTPGMTVGVNTDVIAAEKMIVTAGAVDTHVHFICPQLWTEALASGTVSPSPLLWPD